ncbi:MAG: efflux RND transporter periplasmic adaptor subunit [Pseudomonadota bacterium]
MTRETAHIRFRRSTAAAAVLLAAVTLLPAGVVAQAGPTPVIVEQARIDRFEDQVEALGTLLANESVDLTAKVTERIARIDFNDGQEVEAGDVLAEMISNEQSALLEEARFEMAEAREQFERVRPLARQGYATGTQLDERRRQYETAQARYRAMQSRLDDRLVIAPFSGVVGLRNISVGALVEPGTVITTLKDLSVMKLDFSVPAPFLSALRPGLPIRAMTAALGDRVFEGVVSSIDNQIDPVTRSILVRALIPNEDRALRPGLLMSVELIKEPRDTLVIAEEALIRRAGESYVFVVVANDEGQEIVEQRRVELGGRRQGEVEVLNGLVPGEFVITHGTIKVRPGMPVTITAQQPDSDISALIRRQDG